MNCLTMVRAGEGVEGGLWGPEEGQGWGAFEVGGEREGVGGSSCLGKQSEVAELASYAFDGSYGRRSLAFLDDAGGSACANQNQEVEGFGDEGQLTGPPVMSAERAINHRGTVASSRSSCSRLHVAS